MERERKVVYYIETVLSFSSPMPGGGYIQVREEFLCARQRARGNKNGDGRQ